MPQLSRRTLIAGGIGGSAAAVALASWPEAVAASAPFVHGVASGDPLPHQVVLWTRVTPLGRGTARLRSRSRRQRRLGDLPQRGVHPGRRIRYVDSQRRLGPHGARRRAGTQPGDGVLVSLQRPRQHLAGRPDANGGRAGHRGAGAVRGGVLRQLRLGLLRALPLPRGTRRTSTRCCTSATTSTSTPPAASSATTRSTRATREPLHECLDLADYRTRHGCYKLETDLQDLHARHPMVAVWDDHEIANDTWRDGAENHDPATEGEWLNRATAGRRAWLEWLPVRHTDPG